MESSAIRLLLVVGSFQVAFGGYIPAQLPASYYPTAAGVYPTLVNQPLTFVPVQPKQPLQLRPPTTVAAVPNTRPPVIAIHAEQPIQTVSQISTGSALPVVAIQAAPNKIVLPEASVPSYSFGYAVKDLVTGDEKTHEESRTGDNVVGRYTVVEPDGTLRTVTYTAGVNGFNAIVERTPGYAPPNAPAKVVAISKPVAIASPISVGVPAAVAVSAPRPIVISNPNLVKPVQAVPTYPAGFHFGG